MYNPFGFARYRDLPNLSPMFGNIGKDWNNPLPNDLFIKGVPKNILNSFTKTGNVGTGLDTLRSFTFPAKSLAKNGDLFQAILGGGFGVNDDNKRIQISFGGNVVFNTGSLDIDNLAWQGDLVVIRLDSTHVNWILTSSYGQIVADSTPALQVQTVGNVHGSYNGDNVAVSNMDTNSNILLLEAESATATNDNIFHNVAKIELTRF